MFDLPIATISAQHGKRLRWADKSLHYEPTVLTEGDLAGRAEALAKSARITPVA